jgi:hypothetical protein
MVRDALDQVPDEWLVDEPGFDSPAAVRAAYRHYFDERLTARAGWEAALDAAVAAGPTRTPQRGPRPGWLR